MTLDRSEIPEASVEVWDALEAVAPEPLSAGAKDRIERALRLAMEARSNRGGRSMHSRRSLAAATVAALVVGAAIGFGLATTPTTDRAPPPGGDRYLLLVHDNEAVERAIADRGIEAIVQEYSAWARSLEDEGRLVAATELRPSPRWVGDPARTSSSISGYFLIRAASEAEAVEIARGSPHARLGGVLEVRELGGAENPR